MRVLEIEGSFDTSDIVEGFDKVERSAGGMASAVERASSKAATSASKLDRVGESADNLDSKSAQATGSLGALSSGFELVGAEKYATGLQSAALATDFLAGVGEGLNLITNLSIVAKARDALATARQAVANRLAAAATRAQAVAQRLLNVAMRANPIGLIITAVVLLVGFLVVLYRRNQRVRDIINAVGRAGRTALGWVIDKARDLVGWARDKLPGAFSVAKTLVVGYIKLITLPLRTVVTVATSIVKWVKEKIPGAFDTAKTKASNIASALTSPFRSLLDLVQDIVSWVGKIKIPDLPNIPGLGRVAPGASTSGGGVTGAGTTPRGTTINVTINGVVDERTARQLDRTLADIARRNGVTA
jgi:hypothetical protein